MNFENVIINEFTIIISNDGHQMLPVVCKMCLYLKI